MRNQPVVFAFDLDGTVTRRELLPLFAEAAGIGEEMSRLTARTLSGAIPFARSFRRRFSMLRHMPLQTMRAVAAATPLDPHICAFIRDNAARCAIVTGNLDLWITPIADALQCRFFSSLGEERDGALHLVSVLDKARAVRDLRRQCRRVVAIGESVGDMPMFRAADIGIAYAGVHEPVPGILRLAHHVAADSEELCAILRRL